MQEYEIQRNKPVLSQEVSKLQMERGVWRSWCCWCLHALRWSLMDTLDLGLTCQAAAILEPLLSSLGLSLGYAWSWSSSQHLCYLAAWLYLQFVTSVVSNVSSWVASSKSIIIYPAQMEHSCFSMALNSSVLKFVSRSKMFEKVTCCFSLWNLESQLEILFWSNM